MEDSGVVCTNGVVPTSEKETLQIFSRELNNYALRCENRTFGEGGGLHVTRPQRVIPAGPGPRAMSNHRKIIARTHVLIHGTKDGN